MKRQKVISGLMHAIGNSHDHLLSGFGERRNLSHLDLQFKKRKEDDHLSRTACTTLFSFTVTAELSGIPTGYSILLFHKKLN